MTNQDLVVLRLHGLVRMRFDSAAQRDQVARALGAAEALRQTLNRLEAYVAGRTRG